MYQKGVIQGHLCPRTVFQAVLPLDVISHIVFLYNTSVKYTVGGLFLIFDVHITYCWLCQPGELRWILFKISLKFGPSGPINNIAAFVQIMAWRRPKQATGLHYFVSITLTPCEWWCSHLIVGNVFVFQDPLWAWTVPVQFLNKYYL